MSFQSQQELATQAQNEKYKRENELMRKLGTAPGFFAYYYDQLPKHKTRIETFNHVNETYFELFGQYRFSSHSSFLNSLNLHLKK